MSADYWVERDGNPVRVDFDEYVSSRPSAGGRRVAEDWAEGYWISTVFLGVDHQFGPGPPLLYETMVFPVTEDGHTSYIEAYCDRYSTREQAAKGHKRIVEKLRAGELDLYVYEDAE